VPSPPPYDGHTMTLPPPYSPTDTADKPPDYEVVLLRNGQCMYRPRIESDTAESDDQHAPQQLNCTTVWSDATGVGMHVAAYNVEGIG